MHAHAPLIDALGGGTKIAEALTDLTGDPVDRDRVYKWKTIGIPWRWRGPVKQLAEKTGIPLPDGFLFEGAA